MGYSIKELRDNVGISEEHPSFSTFDILTEYEGVTKWLSVPHELYFPWALQDSVKLQEYMDKKNFKNFEEAIKDLSELEYDWKTQMTRYIDKFYPKKLFPLLPAYNPNNFGEEIDEEDDD